MGKNRLTKISLGSLLCLLTLCSGCVIQIGGCGRAKYERTETLQSPLAPGSTVVVESSFGSITVTGADVADCDITAEIHVQAPTEQKAQEIAEQVKIKLIHNEATLLIKVEKPRLTNNCSVGVSFDITVPKQTNLECHTSYGQIKVANINGKVKGKTGFASIKAKSIDGSLHLQTSYGSINCQDITSAELTAISSFGSIDIACSPATPPEINANISTSYGSIEFLTPPEFSGFVDLTTSYGSIKTDLPITVKGDLGKQRIKGTIGYGQGKLNLTTSFGSIRIK